MHTSIYRTVHWIYIGTGVAFMQSTRRVVECEGNVNELVSTFTQLKHQGCFKQAWSPQLQFMTVRDVQNSSYLQLEGKLRVNFSKESGRLSLSIIIATSTSIQGSLESLSQAILYHYQPGKLHIYIHFNKAWLLESSSTIVEV